MFKLAFMDLDGTLLDRSGTVTPRTRAALRSLVEHGVAVVLASGRPPRMVVHVQQDLGLAWPAICYNGGLITGGPSGRTLWQKKIEPSLARRVLEIFRRAGVRDILCEADDCLAGELGDELLAEAQRGQWGLRDGLSIDDAMRNGAHKLVAVDPPGGMESISAALRAEFGGRVDLVTSAPGTDWLEVIPPGVNKAVAAEMVAGFLGLDLAQAAAFGDAENDAMLLARVGMGVAMSNGDPRARAAARRLAPPNDQDGLALVVEEFLAAG